MKSLVRSLCELIARGEHVVLATVVESFGSTPRTAGAKMIVQRQGQPIGSVGGGPVEHSACENGLRMLNAEDGAAKILHMNMTLESAAEDGMICGGKVVVLLESVEPGGSAALAYEKLNELMRNDVQVALYSRYDGGETLQAVEHTVVQESTDTTTVFRKTEEGIILLESFRPPDSLYIFGAGHVSLFTSRIAAMIGFRTVILDDRAEFADRRRFPEADEVMVLESFADCCSRLNIDASSFLVILTRGHEHDRTVLAQALRMNARYIGMIGSRQKRDRIYEALRAEGFLQSDLDRCRCPIGLPIGGKTPEEIAVSIVAELIRERSEGTG